MERTKLIEKLAEKTNISYEDAGKALEESNWDILDAMLYLENTGKAAKPSVSVFYTNKAKYSYEKGEIVNVQTTKNNTSNNSEGIFERICNLIDTCNNIIIEMKSNDKVFLNIPLTAIIILLFFTFGVTIPLIIIALFFDIEFYVYSKKVNTDKVNEILKKIFSKVKDIKEKFKRSSNNG